MENEICSLIIRKASGSEILESEQEVYCKKKSCTRSEFYAAYTVGLSPRFILEIDPMDFEFCSAQSETGNLYPTKVKYNGMTYTILRTYEADETSMEMTVG